MNHNKKVVVIDKDVALSFIHQSNHLDYQFIPKEILDMEFELRANLGKTSIKKVIDQAKQRVDDLANYMRVAIGYNREIHPDSGDK